MTDEFDVRLRSGFADLKLPPAPMSLLSAVAQLEVDATSPRTRRRRRWPLLLTASAAALLLIAGSLFTILLSSGANTSAPPVAPTPTSTPTPGPSGTSLTVSEAIAKRDAGELGSSQITLVGYWTYRGSSHSCAAPRSNPGELEIYCHDGEFGITERDEAVINYTADFRAIPASGPFLTPFITNDLAQRLVLPPVGDTPFPPVPIVVAGHFDDPRAADCRQEAMDVCRNRFVIDEILSFDPGSVPPPTPSPTPTPFPSPAPAALFGPEMCAGDVDYSFVGWTTTADLHIQFERPGHVYAMVTKVMPIGDWINDPMGSGQKFRWWGQKVCLTPDSEIGNGFNSLIEYGSVRGTGFKEWEDGRHEPGDPP
jgi:hypothetical protein